MLKDREELIRSLKFNIYLIRQSPLTIAGFIIILIYFIIALFAEYIAPSPIDATLAIVHLEDKLRPPSLEHPFGTDHVGRDVISRVVFGARVSLIIGLAAVGSILLVGVSVGLVAGYYGKWLDEVFMRLTDVFLAIPSLILAILISVALGKGIGNTAIAVAMGWWPVYARIVRGLALSIREQQYVEAARMVGASRSRIVLRHIFPNTISPVVVQSTLDLGNVILVAAGLGFIGLGPPPPIPEWGTMIADARIFFPTYWWIAAFPGLAIALTVIGFNLFGDGLRDILEPRLRK